MTQEEIRDKEGYKWIRFYEKLADCLYEDAMKAKKNGKEYWDGDLFREIKTIEGLIDVEDPFSLFHKFNTTKSLKNKIGLMKTINEKLPKNSYVFDQEEMKNSKGRYYFTNPPLYSTSKGSKSKNLWDLFIKAIEYSREAGNKDNKECETEFIKSFNIAIKKDQSVESEEKDNQYNIPCGLSWISPMTFIAIRGNPAAEQFWKNNKDFLPLINKIKSEGGEIYLSFIKKLHEKFQSKSLPELTENILTMRNNKDNQHKGEETMADMNIKQIIKDAITEYRQVIFTGAPGTGKTYGVKKAVSEIVQETSEEKDEEIDERIKFVQFHSSYDYSDFVEGLRPVKIGDSNTFVRLDGHFKEFCRKAVENNLEELINNNYITGKNKLDQINSLKKKMTSDEEAEKIKDSIRKEFPQFYFIIDEINRADIGKVFGELMYGLEEGYRGVENRFDTQYSNLDTYHKVKDKDEFVKYEKGKDVFYEGFFIPENVHIIGTMNDIDRSVETFDFALRRRFQWVRIPAYKGEGKEFKRLIKEMLGLGEVGWLDELVHRIGELNNKISEKKELGLSDDYCLGQAYFKWDGQGTDDPENYPYVKVWEKRIEPILREYVRGRNSEKVAEFIKKCREAFVGNPENEGSGNNATASSSEIQE